MSNWIVITRVSSDTDPATWSYVNGTTFISSTEVSNDQQR